MLQLNGRALSLYGATSGTPTIKDNTSSSTLGLYSVGDLSSLRFDGASPYLHNLILNRTYARGIAFPSGCSLTLGGAITFTKGILLTGSNKITLAPTAALGTETDSSHIRGTLEETITLAQNVAQSFSNMRVTILAAGAAPGVTTITRINDAPVFMGIGNSVRMRYAITPTVDAGLNATLTMRLLNSELNGKAPGALILNRLPAGDTIWQEQFSTVANAGTLTYSLSNIPSFSTWTLGDPVDVLPVTLTSFTGKATPLGHVELSWETATEQDNAGFALFRMKDGGEFDSLAYIQPGVKTDGRQHYSFTDYKAGTNNIYRLRQYEYSGKATTFPLVFVSTGEAPELGFISVYPIPFSEDISVLNKSSKAHACTLILRSNAGETVYTSKARLGASEIKTIQLPRLPAGAYILEVAEGAGKHFVRVVKQ